MKMWSEGNHLHFSDKVADDVLPVTAALHNLITKQGEREIILDFRNVGFVTPSFMIPLATVCRSYRRDRVNFDLIMPEDIKTCQLFSNTNWAHLIVPEKYEDKRQNNIRHLSATQFFTAEEHFHAVDASLDVLLQRASGIDRSHFQALEWALNEITDNVLNHSESPVGGIMQVMTFPKRKRVEFFVCDAGITIPRSLRQGRSDIHDDATALRAAINEGVTKNKVTNQGNGLFGTFKCCEVSGGEFNILSGVTSLRHQPGELHVGRNPIPYSGTFVRACIDYSVDGLLEKALVFGGRPHEPAFDYIDRVYQPDGDLIQFTIRNELTSFGSRDSGRYARNKIDALMNNRSTPIEFNFDGIRLVSSSFADEVFGRLFSELGPIQFSQLCTFKNVDRTVQGLIDRAITQRMRV